MKKRTTPPPYRPANGQQPYGQQQPQQPYGQRPPYQPQQPYGQPYGQPPYQPAAGQTPPPHRHYTPQRPKNEKWKGCALGCLISFGLFMILGVIGLLLEDEETSTPQTSLPPTPSEGGGHTLGQFETDSTEVLANDSTDVAWVDIYAKQEVHPTPREWTIDNVPMAHLEHKRQYVSDPDGYMSDWQRARADSFLYMIEHQLDVQSAFIVVGRVPNKDAQRFAIDLGKKYGISTADTHRGVTICIAVADRKFSLSTSQGVQEQLTDLKCGRITDRYIIPNMKADNTGAAVMQTCEALYFTLKDGEPHLADSIADAQITQAMSQAPQKKMSDDEKTSVVVGFLVIIFGGIIWYIFKKFVPNPFRSSHSYNGLSQSGSGSYNYDSDDDDDDYSSSSSDYDDDDGGSYGGDDSYDGGGSSGGW